MFERKYKDETIALLSSNEVHHQSSEREQTVESDFPDLHHRSPESGDLQFKPRELKKAICSYSEGCWTVMKAFTDQVQHHSRKAAAF